MISAPSIEEYVEDLKRLEAKHPTVKIELPPAHLIAIIGALHLALRHPQFPETSGRIIREFIDQCQASFKEFPVVQLVVLLGADERFDE